ncbi:MAG: choice-of-anchor M domain-containing protein [Verrucomicrobiota bacterium]
MRLLAAALLLCLLTGWLEGNPLEGRVRLVTEHADLRVVLAPEGTNLFQLAVRDSDRRTNHLAIRAALMVQESARNTIPEGFDVLGPAGSDLWILPQSQDPQHLYLGASGEGLPAGVVEQGPSIRLLRIEGPGHFVVWQGDALEGVLVRMSSRDGISEVDQLTLSVGGHAHFNWGFSRSGFVTVWMQVQASVGGTNATSPATPILFAVEPLPSVPWAIPSITVSRVDPSGAIRLVVSGNSGASYQVQESTNLLIWEDVLSVTPETTTTEVTLPPSGDPTTRFLRVRLR